MTGFGIILLILGIGLGFFQLLGAAFGLFANNEEWGSLKEDDNGMVDVKLSDSLFDWLFMTIGITILAFRRKSYVRYIAQKAAENKKYDNRFKKNSFKDVYDKAYLAKRKELLEQRVESDLAKGEKTTCFLNDSEKALYQNIYLQKTTGKETIENLVAQRAKELYDEIEFEPVEDHVFEQISAKATH